MSAIAEPPVTTAGAKSPAVLTRAQGLELLGELQGSGYRDDVALVRRADGQMVQLGPLMYALLEAVDGRRDARDLAAAMSERLGRQVDPEHVAPLAQKLAAQGLLGGFEDNAPAPVNPLLGLRWKYLVTDPEVTRRATSPFTGFFRPWVIVPVLVAFLAVVWFVLVEKGVASATAEAFRNPELLLLVFLLALGSAGFHELGHAAACRYGGATPGGMGVGLYMVWPAFYTDVTDSYRLPRRGRLRVDLGGLYFNTLVAVVTLGIWLALRVDALLLLVALQLLQMVKQLSPVIRADGYHILSDLTGVPDLYQHMGPTLKRLIPGRDREPSALTGRARALVTAWVLIVVPLLLALSISFLLLFPRLVATAWESGSRIAGDIPDGNVAEGILGVLRLIALALPVLGVAAMAQKMIRSGLAKARSWSEGRPGRRAVLALGTALALAAMLWAWWPSGQYRPVRASDDGTLAGAGRLLTTPAAAVRAPGAELAELRPGKHLAVALIPEGGATKDRPAFFVIRGTDDQEPVVVMSPTAADPGDASEPGGTAPAAPVDAESADPAAGSSPEPTAAGSAGATPVPAAAFPFELPADPGPHGTRAMAVNTEDGSVKYVVAYTVVTVHDGRAVDETNEAYAFASCNACTTVAVSFQVVLIVGTSDLIAPINVAGALNVDCPSCITTAIANQIVVTLDEEPSEELLARLNTELAKLDGISGLDTPQEIAAAVDAVEEQIHEELDASGLTPGSDDPEPTGTSTAPAPSSTAPAESTSTTEQPADGSETTTTTTPEEEPATETAPAPSDTSTSPAPSDTTTAPAESGETTSTTP